MHPRKVYIRVFIVNEDILQPFASGNKRSPEGGSNSVDEDFVLIEERLYGLLLCGL